MWKSYFCVISVTIINRFSDFHCKVDGGSVLTHFVKVAVSPMLLLLLAWLGKASVFDCVMKSGSSTAMAAMEGKKKLNCALKPKQKNEDRWIRP